MGAFDADALSARAEKVRAAQSALARSQVEQARVARTYYEESVRPMVLEAFTVLASRTAIRNQYGGYGGGALRISGDGDLFIWGDAVTPTGFYATRSGEGPMWGDRLLQSVLEELIVNVLAEEQQLQRKTNNMLGRLNDPTQRTEPRYHRFSDAERAANEQSRRDAGLPPSRPRSDPPEIRVSRPVTGERFSVAERARLEPEPRKRKNRWWSR